MYPESPAAQISEGSMRHFTNGPIPTQDRIESEQENRDVEETKNDRGNNEQDSNLEHGNVNDRSTGHTFAYNSNRIGANAQSFVGTQPGALEDHGKGSESAQGEDEH